MSKAEWQAYEEFNSWRQKEDRRVCREWDREWDGSELHGIAINDRQCERIQAAADRLGITDDMMMRFRQMELARWQERSA